MPNKILIENIDINYENMSIFIYIYVSVCKHIVYISIYIYI